MTMPSWKYILSYETDSMTRDEIVASTYEAALRLNKLKHEYGLIDDRLFNDIDYRIKMAGKIIQDIDEIMLITDKPERDKRLQEIKLVVEQVNRHTICGKDELKWPVHQRFTNAFSLFKILLGLFFKEWALLFNRLRLNLTDKNFRTQNNNRKKASNISC